MQKIQARAAHVRARLTKGSFGHNVLVMFAGTALGQLGAVIAAPALTRLYTPEDFGALGAFSAILGIIVVIATLRYEMAIPLTREDHTAANMQALCGLALCVTTALLTLALTVFTPDRFSWAGLGVLEPYRYLLPVGFFFLGAYQTVVNIATRQQDFKAIAQTKLYQGGAGPLTQIGLGFANIGALGLIAGTIVGQSMGVTQLIWRLIVKKPAMRAGISWAAMRTLAKRYQRFPLLSSWSALINVAGGSALLWLAVPWLYSPAIAGYIFLTDRVIGRPLLMISSSILQVYMGEAAKAVTSDPAVLKRRFMQLAKAQFAIVSFWLLLVNATAAWLFPIVFGPEWAEAVPYLHVLSIAMLMQLVSHALIHTLQILERQGLSALWEIGRLLLVGGSFALSWWLDFSALKALLLYSICQAGAQILLLCLMYRSIQQLQGAAAKKESQIGHDA